MKDWGLGRGGHLGTGGSRSLGFRETELGVGGWRDERWGRCLGQRIGGEGRTVMQSRFYEIKIVKIIKIIRLKNLK